MDAMDVNFVSEDDLKRKTVLMRAVGRPKEYRRPGIHDPTKAIEMLLRRRELKLNAEDMKGFTALSYALEAKNHQYAALLVKAGAVEKQDRMSIGRDWFHLTLRGCVDRYPYLPASWDKPWGRSSGPSASSSG
jgi:hypothetical protein